MGTTAQEPSLLLGEWACLGILYQGPAHGFAVAARLKTSGDVGRVWTVSRPLTYRALDQLTAHGYVEPVRQEPGVAGGERTVLAATRRGRARFRKWLATPVPHVRNLRSELLLKLVLADGCRIDPLPMLEQQRETLVRLAGAVAERTGSEEIDVVTLWRQESIAAAVRFVDAVVEIRQRR